jgi:hypothetical protein
MAPYICCLSAISKKSVSANGRSLTEQNAEQNFGFRHDRTDTAAEKRIRTEAEIAEYFANAVICLR